MGADDDTQEMEFLRPMTAEEMKKTVDELARDMPG